MRSSKGYLLFLLLILAGIGAAGAAMGLVGDTSVVAATGSVYAALERAGQADNMNLRNELYAVVLQQKQLWTGVGLGGLVATVIALLAMVIARSSDK